MMKPDFECDISWITFTGESLSVALRKLADYVEGSNLDYDENIRTIETDWDDHDEIWRVATYGGRAS